VEYVLSDKTGTLTQNVMGFVLASIGGRLYGHTPATHAPGAPAGGGAGAGFMAAQGSVADVPNNTPHTVSCCAWVWARRGGAGWGRAGRGGARQRD
jgi:magnesium-transporting ATPase (P-type)